MSVLKIFEYIWVRPSMQALQPKVSRGGCNTMCEVRFDIKKQKKKSKAGEAQVK